jgi:transcriptional regulator with XRE-family HTH domain
VESVFYDRFKELCDKRGISCNRAAIDIGLSNATPSQWKNKGMTPKADTLEKIAAFFNVSTDYLLGKEEQKTPTPKSERDDSEIMFALSRGGEQEITEEMFEEVKRFAAYVAELERKKKLP